MATTERHSPTLLKRREWRMGEIKGSKNSKTIASQYTNKEKSANERKYGKTQIHKKKLHEKSSQAMGQHDSYKPIH